MMVVHEDNDRPVEVAVIRKPLLEQKSYVIVKNHVRELPSTTQNINTNMNEDTSQQSSGNAGNKNKKEKSGKKHKKTQETEPTTSESEINLNSTTEIDPSDLAELKTVYKKCKEVIEQIETKYGHLLELDNDKGISSSYEKRKMLPQSSEDECQCKLKKKKIVFDDEGRQSMVETISESHICGKNSKSVPNLRNNISVEFQDTGRELPDNLTELRELLHNTNLDKVSRNNILEKIRQIKQEYVNDVRFNRLMLIEKLKANSDEILDFKGTNLSSIPGYP